MTPEIKQYIDQLIQSHIHDGNFAQRIFAQNIYGSLPQTAGLYPATVATTGNTDVYLIAPITGILESADFSTVDALGADNTNYVTFTITNLGQAGAGSTALLDPVAANTTKATGGMAIAANTKRSLTLSTVPNNLQVIEGDRLRVRIAATGTLANTLTFPSLMVRFV